MADKQLKLRIPPNWREASRELGVKITTLVRENSVESGALQFSTAWYVSGPVPNSGPAELIDLAKNITLNGAEVGDIEDGYVGDCSLGTFATVISRPQGHRLQVWCLSNGYDFVFATHTSAPKTESDECDEAGSIVRAVTVKNGGAPKPWWRIW